ncbi:MAG: phosphotransferase family protein [Alphaproteobacteria bacterium]|nr:phosphotransferase family protein [Alphaproteobacteria bacterium]HCP01354.1 phosphotransferase family protein [Rhodospirillaceae bacterium]
MPDGLHAGPSPRFPVSEDQLGIWFADRLLSPEARITSLRLMSGGAVQHNWRIDVEVGAKITPYVLRAGPDVQLPESLSKSDEFAFLRIAHSAGVPVAEPMWLSNAKIPFLVTRYVAGDTAVDRLTARDDNVALIRELAAALARIHLVSPGGEGTAVFASERVMQLETWVEALSPLPTNISYGLAAGLAWLRTNLPLAIQARLVHRDFRTGNFLVDGDHLTAVLDWEFAGWGDPAEDIGWFCGACWRGNAPDREAGGLGSRTTFYRAYAAAGGHVPDRARVRFWEVFAHLRWAVIALQQGRRARVGAYPAWELEEAEARVPGLLCAAMGLVGSEL